MTHTFANPADAAEAMIQQVLELRHRVVQSRLDAVGFGRTSATFHGAEQVTSAMREDAILQCLGFVLGATDEASVDAFVEAWAVRAGVDLGDAAVRIREMPTAGDLYDQQAKEQVLESLRDAGEDGLSKTRFLQLLSADRLAFGRGGEDSRWLRQWLREGVVIERQRGRGTNYVHREFSIFRAPASESGKP
ncbi:hypothetical protein E6W39_29185 [Kitasatospora acidiphila]|uniref:Uncharacterized protein n=1 Tax=Kitasatospora acidiphila TaxID=2567942 RepID=A0A540W959_9ACTN|nr:hypothetical protein [Kitasatospora acidiphila]TQF05559.1 hypothetical protein E6W39_29185 [Kitasatospora acidiphila]